MNNYQLSITPEEYLSKQGIDYKQRNGELVFYCPFNDCDSDSRQNEAHCYMDVEEGLYDCKKCGEQGNLITFLKHFGDSPKDFQSKNSQPVKQKQSPSKKVKKVPTPILPLSSDEVEKCHQQLPDNIRKYLNERLISDEIISRQKIGWMKHQGIDWITIPVYENGVPKYMKLRVSPFLPSHRQEKRKMLFYPSGNEASIFGIDRLRKVKFAIECEGEMDTMVLWSHGIDAFTTTAGAMTFIEDSLKEYKHLDDVYICYDRDRDGVNGSIKTINKLLALKGGPRVHRILLPEMPDGHNDITDYFKYHGGTPEKLFQRAELITEPIVNRIARVPKPKSEVTFEEWKRVIQEAFPEYAYIAEIVLSVVAQLLINDVFNPFALVLIDVPSAGKTIILNFVTGILEIVYSTDKFTPASFVSNAANVKLEKLGDIDLLPRIRHKTLVIRDMSSIFGERDDDLLKSMGIMTRVLDGEGYQTDSGVHGQRQYVGDYVFQMLAASTPIPSRVFKIMANFGSRLFFVSLDSPDKGEDELANQLLAENYKVKERRCRAITREFLYTLWQRHSTGVDWDKSQEDKETIKKIGRISNLLAHLRAPMESSVEYDDEGKAETVFSPPVTEKPTRINQLLYNLCRGHALIMGRRTINDEDLKIALRVALDSAQLNRIKLLKAVLRNGGELSTSQVEHEMAVSKPMALKYMRELAALRVCQLKDYNGRGSEKTLTLHYDFEWFNSEEFQALWQG